MSHNRTVPLIFKMATQKPLEDLFTCAVCHSDHSPLSLIDCNSCHRVVHDTDCYSMQTGLCVLCSSSSLPQIQPPSSQPPSESRPLLAIVHDHSTTVCKVCLDDHSPLSFIECRICHDMVHDFECYSYELGLCQPCQFHDKKLSPKRYL